MMHRTMRLLLVLLMVAAVCPAAAALQDDDAPQADAAKERQARLAELSRAMRDCVAKEDWAGAAATCRELIELAPKHPVPQYNLACYLARQGKTDEALTALSAAIDKGFSDADHITTDPDLESLRTSETFAALIKRAHENARKEERQFYEPHKDIEGVRTLERDPDGGLRYRLRMNPDTSKDNPQRLVIWLHPSGGSGNRMAESLIRRLIKQNYALLLPNQKNWRGWTEAEAARLMGPTLRDVAKVEGIDATRPVLMGFSAGGQLALQLWHEDPAALGGLIVDAAYPVQIDIDPKTGRATQTTLAPPKHDARKSVPIYVLVGDRDQAGRGVEIWQRVEPAWREAGVPLTIDGVKDGQHAWLVGKTQADSLETWLKAIHANQTPTDPPRPE